MSGFIAVIDPPWSRDAGGGGRGAGNHYELANPSRIAEGYWKARNDEGQRIWPQAGGSDPMLVFMWATTGAMTMEDDVDPRQELLLPDPDRWDPPDAYVLARMLGLRVCATFVWCKVDEVMAEPAQGSITRRIAFWPPAQKGIGQWSRCEHEFLLLCRHGDVPVPPSEVRPRSVIYAPRGKHSEKPEQAWRQVIEPIARHCMPDRVGVEFNCRTQRPGWAAFGALDGEDKPLRYSPDMPMATR